jgi:hypothetical protein
MTAAIREHTQTVEISALEKKYVRMVVDRERFLSVFEPNGLQAKDYRYYLSEDDDVEYFSAAYEKEDPRLIDYPPEDGEEERYLELPYPDLSLFAEIEIDKKGRTILASLSICTVYST